MFYLPKWQIDNSSKIKGFEVENLPDKPVNKNLFFIISLEKTTDALVSFLKEI